MHIYNYNLFPNVSNIGEGNLKVVKAFEKQNYLRRMYVTMNNFEVWKRINRDFVV